MSLLKINNQRLKHDIETLATIGREPDNQGINRPAFSDADMQARAWLKQQIELAGLEVYEDGAGNIHGRLNWDETQASVMTGSHIDSVPGGGHLDGVLGVLGGLECLRTLKESGIALSRPLEVVAFSDEEGRFGGLFGSSAMCGQLTPEAIHQARDLTRQSIVEAMAKQGLNAMDALTATRKPESLHAFVELHIEQGPILEQKQLHLGVVDVINGLVKWQVRLRGSAAHAGAAPMDMRKDAFQGLAEFGVELPKLVKQYGGDRSVATIGRVTLSPGAANVVPRLAEFSLDVRDSDQDTLNNLIDAIHRFLSDMARRRQLNFDYELHSEIEPVNCDREICNLIDDTASRLGINHTRMASGAAHDTEIMASIVRTGLIFVPSKGGVSHTPAEWTDWQDIFNGTNVLLNTLFQLVNEE